MRQEASGRRVDAATAWQVLANTDLMNRLGERGQILAQGIEPDERGFPRLAGDMEGPLGTRLPFVERDVSWIHGRLMRQERLYDSQLVRRTNYTLDLDPDGDGVIPHVSLTIEPATPLLAPVARAALTSTMKRWQAVLDGLPEPGRVWQLADIGGAVPLPKAADDMLRSWRDEGDAEVVDRLRTTLLTTSPIELQKLRPFALADRWGLDRERVLVSLLSGIERGILELYWSSRCPRCYGSTEVASLSDLADHWTCPTCQIGVEPDLGRTVEAVLAPHPALVPKAHDTYCTTFPVAAPDLQAVIFVPRGATVLETIPMIRGDWRLGSGGASEDVLMRVGGEGIDHLVWSPGQPSATVAIRAGEVDVELANGDDADLRVLGRRDRDDTDIVPASLLTTLPSFRGTMGHQVLAAGTRLSVRSVALLFTDLGGSTAMYEALGDAGAFAFVRDHFELLRGVLAAHDGVEVKSIGDAIMAAFHDPADAVAAALAMRDAFAAWVAEQPVDPAPTLRVGVHAGPALAVHTDQAGLDYFGGTVNLAARTESSCDAGQVRWTDAVHADPRVAARLAEAGVEPRATSVDLKGIDGPIRVWIA